MLLELFLGALTVLLVWDYFFKKRRNDILNKCKITGPTCYPVLGAAIQVSKYNNETIFEISKENKRKYGKVFRVWVLHQLAVVIMWHRV